MTREQIADLLEELINAYPYYAGKITDAESMLNTWERELGAEDAGAIYKAARHWINHSRYWPQISDIRHSINKGQIMYGDDRKGPPKIEPEKVKLIDPNFTFCDLCGLCDRQNQELCEYDF